MQYGCIVGQKGITVHFSNGDDFTWPEGHVNFVQVREAIKSNAGETVLRGLMDVVGNLQKQLDAEPALVGHVQVSRDGVYWHGRPIHMTICDRIMAFNSEGMPIASLVAFLDKLLTNQRREAVMSLYDFLEANTVPITEDGDFIVYKKVRNDYKDIHSGTFDNSVGQKPRIPHWEVDPDRDNTCSKGLHVCARHYLASFGSSGSGDRVMVCKVNPADVVAVPRDYNNSKMRVAGYEVIGELKDEERAKILDQSKILRPGDHTEDVTWGENFTEEEEESADDYQDYNYYDQSHGDDDDDDDECPQCGAWTGDGVICDECEADENDECEEDENDERDHPVADEEKPATQTSWKDRWINPFKRR
jgi:hypothetical protein